MRAIYVRADMAKGDDCRALVAKAAAALGRVDMLVNNAGIQHVAPIPDFPPETGTGSSRSTSARPSTLRRRRCR